MEKSKNIRGIDCSVCNGKGVIEKINDDLYDREDDKLPSGHLARIRARNRGFISERKCNNCDGYGFFLEGY